VYQRVLAYTELDTMTVCVNFVVLKGVGMITRKWLLVGTVMLGLRIVTLRVSEGSAAKASVPPPHAQDAKVLADAYGIHFLPEAVPEGEGPVLPSGQRGVTMQQAVDVAMHDSPASGFATSNEHLRPGVAVVARYGRFTNARYGKWFPGGDIQPKWVDHPTWFVTFGGLQVPSFGRSKAVHSQMKVFIDAGTGQYLMAYNY